MELNIIIYGKFASGKSTVAKLIADTLEKHGIPCEVDDGGDGYYGKFQADKLASLAKHNDFIVKVKTQATSAAGKINTKYTDVVVEEDFWNDH